jgi:hypothetical protein
VYVADGIKREVVVFSPRGERLHQIGRSGAGPGEYRSPASIALLGDTLAVYDAGNLRIGLFDRSGKWLGQWPLRPANGLLVATNAHEAWARTVRWRGKTYDHVYVRHTASGPGDTVPYRLGPAPTTEPGNSVDCEMSDGSIALFSASAPFVARSVIRPITDGMLAESDPTGYRITFTSGGDTSRVIRYLTQDTLINETEWSAEEAEWKIFRAKNAGGKCTSSLRKASLKRLIADFTTGDEGTLWVIRTVSPGDQQVRLDVFDKAGPLLGKMMAPAHTVRAQRGDRLYLVTRDSLDVETLTAYVIRRNR